MPPMPSLLDASFDEPKDPPAPPTWLSSARARDCFADAWRGARRRARAAPAVAEVTAELRHV